MILDLQQASYIDHEKGNNVMIERHLVHLPPNQNQNIYWTNTRKVRYYKRISVREYLYTRMQAVHLKSWIVSPQQDLATWSQKVSIPKWTKSNAVWEKRLSKHSSFPLGVLTRVYTAEYWQQPMLSSNQGPFHQFTIHLRVRRRLDWLLPVTHATRFVAKSRIWSFTSASSADNSPARRCKASVGKWETISWKSSFNQNDCGRSFGGSHSLLLTIRDQKQWHQSRQSTQFCLWVN